MTTIAQKIQAQLTADLALNGQDIAALREKLEAAHEQVVNATLAHTVVSDKTEAALQHEAEIETRLKGQLALRETIKRAALGALQQHLVEGAKGKGVPSSMADSLYAMAQQASSTLTTIESTFDEATRLVMIAYHEGPMALVPARRS